MVGPNYRLLVGTVLSIFVAVGFLIVVGMAYMIRTVEYLQLAVTLPAVLLLSYYWLLPESARWLVSRGRMEEAKKILRDVSNTNGTVLPDDLDLNAEVKVVKNRSSIKELLHAPRLMCRSLIIFLNWIVISLGYYGLSLSSDQLPGSLYVNTALSAAAEMLGYMLCFVCFLAGRKWPHVISMSAGGMACILSVIVYFYVHADESVKKWIFIGLNQVGKLGVTIGFTIIYIWCAELFPTVIRTSMIGVSSMLSRIGSISAPYISDMGDFVPPQYAETMPSLIYGVLMLAGGLLSVGLPDTTGYDLPETVAEAELFPPQRNTVIVNASINDVTQDSEQTNDDSSDSAILVTA